MGIMKKIFLIIAMASVIWGCKSGSEKLDMASIATEAEPNLRMAQDMPAQSIRGNESSPSGQQNLSSQKIIRNARLSIEVENYDKAYVELDTIVKRHNAWISSENLNNYDHRIVNNMSIRVPANSLDPLIEGIHNIAINIENQSIQSTDVTEEYIDIESRLKNQREVEQKFINLLKRANSIDDILRIESKLADIRGDIESVEGRLRYLNNRIDYSTVDLHIYQKIDFKYEPEPIDSFGERIKRAFGKGWHGFISFTIFVFALWPLWIITASIIWITIRIKRRRKNRKAKQ